MSIGYDETSGGFVSVPDQCPFCPPSEDTWRYDTGCTAPGCMGARYDCCGTGCDEGFPGSRCEAALAAESDEEYAARINKHRAVFGLSPIDGSSG